MCSSSFTVRFPCKMRHAARARKALDIYLSRLALDADTRGDVEQAVGEAIANAVEHGFREGTFFELRARVIGSVLRVEVEDDGTGFDPASARSEALRGFGISMMRALVDSVEFFKNGRVARLQKIFRVQPSAPRAVPVENCAVSCRVWPPTGQAPAGIYASSQSVFVTIQNAI